MKDVVTEEDLLASIRKYALLAATVRAGLLAGVFGFLVFILGSTDTSGVPRWALGLSLLSFVATMFLVVIQIFSLERRIRQTPEVASEAQSNGKEGREDSGATR